MVRTTLHDLCVDVFYFAGVGSKYVEEYWSLSRAASGQIKTKNVLMIVTPFAQSSLLFGAPHLDIICVVFLLGKHVAHVHTKT